MSDKRANITFIEKVRRIRNFKGNSQSKFQLHLKTIQTLKLHRIWFQI